jgi:ribonuclease R
MFNADALNQLRQLKTDIEESKVVYPGTVKATNGRFGFVALDEGRDVFLPPEEMQKVLPGDRVNVTEQEGDKGKTQGVVDELLESELDTFVGRYIIRGKGHFVAPETPGINRWIFIPPKERQNAEPDDFIYCKVHRHPIKDGKGQARILKVIGKAGDTGIERALTLATFDLPDTWPGTVQAQAEALDESAINAHRADREDRTGQPYVTIDSPGTQDMDDALLAEPNPTGWKLSIAIADPTALIEPGSPTEQEAFRRATAIYFPGEPLPMLPDGLSTRLCSLMPQAERLALVCDLQVNNDGSLGDYSFHQAVIKSQGKLSYELVSHLIEGRIDDEIRALPDTVTNSLDQLHQAATALRKWRSEHALLRGDRIDNIRALLQTFAPALSELDVTSAEGFRALMKQAQGLAAEVPVKTIISRQLARAELSANPAPHQGMGLAAYTTFTSPLRKYTDFHVHRLIKSALWGEQPATLDAAQLEALQRAQLHARQAANSLENWLKSDFARTLGDGELSGLISRTTPAGFFVRLDSNGLEGFVSCKTLDGKFSFDPVTLRLVHNKNGRIFQLEQPVTVTFTGVDEERKQIVFDLVEKPTET